MSRALRAAAIGLCACALAALAHGGSPAIAQTPRPTPTPGPTATPAPTPVPAIARITAPVREQVLRGNVNVAGSASLPNFARYELSYSIDRPGQDRWQTLFGGTAPVNDGTLAVWSTGVISNGTYALRVEVFDRANGRLESVTRGLVISNTATIGAVAAAPNAPSTGAPAANTSSRFPQINFAAIPGAFMRGVTWAAYGLAALGAYVIGKRLLWWLLARARGHRPLDNGR